LLQELHIVNFALIDNLVISFSDGLTVLTGETGAGKSIIIDALNAVLGERMAPEVIRAGSDEATIEALFDIADSPQALAVLAQADLDEEDDVIILRRQIRADRSRYWINGHPVTLKLLKQVGQQLVDIHGQHQHQTLIYERSHRRFLDGFGGQQHLAAVADFGDCYRSYRAAQQQLEELRSTERERAQRLDILQFQVEEIEQANLCPEEEAQLEAERNRLTYSERLQEALQAGLQALEGVQGEGGAQEGVATAAQQLQQASQLDAQLAPLAKRLEEAAISLQEALFDLHSYHENLEVNPERLDQIEARLNEIRMLKRKYGDSIDQVISYGQQARHELEELENAGQREDELLAEVETRHKQVSERSVQLSQARHELAQCLARQVTQEVRRLGMAEADFQVELRYQPDSEGVLGPDGGRYQCTETGIDEVRFLLSTNPGEPLRPLSQVASGGELSRLMLALKSISTQGVEIPTLVFDEIDVGIGGLSAHAVAERLVVASQGAQVLCVTHLPQIARMADQQIYVEKQTVDGRTVTRATTLSQQERIDDLTRMLGATEDHQLAHQHAEELLAEASEQREKIRSQHRYLDV